MDFRYVAGDPGGRTEEIITLTSKSNPSFLCFHLSS